MKIYNVRLGFATNSSSSHSIVLLDSPPQDHYVEGEYGWDFFTLGSVDAKLDYLSLCLFYALRRVGASVEISLDIVRAWTGKEITLEFGKWPRAHVDHQSILTLPKSWDGVGIDKQFYEELKEYLLRPGIAILGGNDNTEECHPLQDEGRDMTPPIQDLGIDIVARKDGDYWTMFNRDSGTKIRFSFNDGVAPYKASVPELVDVKITDFCPYECEFCYQSSSLQGKHAKEMYWVYKSLREMKVFEVAIGGGEPTLSPHFNYILKSFRDRGIVPNFTTHNLAWLQDPAQWEPIIAQCGGFAYSAHNLEEARKFCSLVNYNGLEEKASVQVIAGIVYPTEIVDIIQLAHDMNVGVTLLGYKDVGRGATFLKKRYQELSDERLFDLVLELIEHKPCRISIDTVLAKKWKDRLLAANVPAWMFHTEDGTFSCYIDAVEGKIAKSSYADEQIKVAIDETLTASIKTLFV